MVQATQRPGILLIDILIGISVFAVMVGVLISGLSFSHRGVISSGERVRATYFAEEALEAVRAIRDADYSALTDGTHGVVREASQWTLSGSSAVTGTGFETAVTISTPETNRKVIVATTTWDFGPNRSGTVTLSSEVSNWRKSVTPGNWSSISLTGSYEDAGTPLFNDAVAVGDYLYVTSEISDGGDGLYVFDISNPASPTRVAASYTLSDPAYGITEYNGYLYVVTGDNTEINVYDISSPTTLSATDIDDTINVDGNGNARGLHAYDDMLFVTTTAGGSAESISAFDISTVGSISSLGTYDEGENYMDVTVIGDYAYTANGADTAEFRVVDVSIPSNMGIPSSSGSYNLTDTSDTLAIAGVSTFVLLGRASTAVSEEIVLFDVTPQPYSGNGPWYLEAGGAVNGVDTDPAETYGFIASENSGKEFSVLNLATFAAGGSPEIANHDTDTGVGRGVYYSWQDDAAFLMTNTAVLIFEPSS